LGDFSLLPEESRIQEAQIQVAADILLIPRSAVVEIGGKYPVLYRNLFVDAGQRSRKMYELMATIMFYPLRARLAARLVHLLTQHGVVVGNGIRLAIKLSQNDFASLCLGSRQRVNKIFREWTEQGILAMQDDYYVIFDLDALKTEINVQEL
jgi:CRP-like cAMP-binding protein